MFNPNSVHHRCRNSRCKGWLKEPVENILAADQRRHERRSGAAKKAAITRQQRQERVVYATAKRLSEGDTIGPRKHCVICGRGLGDPQSIERGVGSECWQGVLVLIKKFGGPFVDYFVKEVREAENKGRQ